MPRPKEKTSRMSQSHASRSQAAQPESHPSVDSQTRRDRKQRSNRHPETSVIGLVDDSRKLRSQRSNPPGSSSANRRHDRSAPHASSSSDHLTSPSKHSQDTPDLISSDYTPSSASPQTPEDSYVGADSIPPGFPQPDDSSSIYSLTNHAASDSTLRCAGAPSLSTDYFSKHAHDDHNDNRSTAKSTSRSEHRAHFLEPSPPNGERPLTLREQVAASNDWRRARAIEQRISTFDLDPRTEALLPSAAATADESHLTREQRIVAANQRRIARATEQRALGADRGPLRLMVPRQRKLSSAKRSNTLLNTSNTPKSSWSGVGGAVRELEEREAMLAWGEILQPEASVLGKRPRYVEKKADGYGQEAANYPATSMRPREVYSKRTRQHTTTEDPKAADTQVRMDKQMVSESRRVRFDETKNQIIRFDEALFRAPYEAPGVTKEEVVVTVHAPTNETASNSSAKQRRQAQPTQTRRHTESHDEGFYETGPPSPVHPPINEATSKPTREKPKQPHATQTHRHIGSRDGGIKEPGSISPVHPPTNETTLKPTESRREKGHLTQTRRDTGSRDEVLNVAGSHLPVHQPTNEAKSKSKVWRKKQHSTQIRDEAFDEPGSLLPVEHDRAVDSKGKHSKARLLDEIKEGPQELTKSSLHKLTSAQRKNLVEKYVRQSDSSSGGVAPEEAKRSINALMAWNHLYWWFDSLGHWPLDASLHGPSMHDCTDISEQPNDANAPQDASVQALRDVMVGETTVGVEFEEYELCVPMQYSSEEAQAMFDFGLPEKGTVSQATQTEPRDTMEHNPRSRSPTGPEMSEVARKSPLGAWLVCPRSILTPPDSGLLNLSTSDSPKQTDVSDLSSAVLSAALQPRLDRLYDRNTSLETVMFNPLVQEEKEIPELEYQIGVCVALTTDERVEQQAVSPPIPPRSRNRPEPKTETQRIGAQCELRRPEVEDTQTVHRSPERKVWSYPLRPNLGKRPGMSKALSAEKAFDPDEDLIEFSDSEA